MPSCCEPPRTSILNELLLVERCQVQLDSRVAELLLLRKRTGVFDSLGLCVVVNTAAAGVLWVNVVVVLPIVSSTL